jgi:TPR repeat protein
MLLKGEGIPMNKSLAVHYLKLAADQRCAPAQLAYGVMITSYKLRVMSREKFAGNCRASFPAWESLPAIVGPLSQPGKMS